MKARPLTAGRILWAARQAELNSGTGATGFTLLKLQNRPLDRLIGTGKIGPEELQAASDIYTVAMTQTGALMLRPHRMERLDPARVDNASAAAVEAYRRYRAWADHWSMRAKRGDKTLQIIWDVVVDDRPLGVMAADLSLDHRTVTRAVVRGLRDYAARAGWVRGKLAERWLAEASNTFKLSPPINT